MHEYGRRLSAWWTEGHDILITPTIPEPPPLLGEFASTPDNPMGGLARGASIVPFTAPFNATGQPAMSVPAGTREVAVALRPDDFEMAGPGTDNAFDATVKATEFGGRTSLLIADSPMGELFVRLGGQFQPGDRVRLHIPPDRVLAYAEAV